MTTAATDALVIALLRAVPAISKPKRCNKHGLGKITRDLRAKIPENGIGPEVHLRRELVQILEGNCLLCPFRGKCGLILPR